MKITFLRKMPNLVGDVTGTLWQIEPPTETTFGTANRLLITPLADYGRGPAMCVSLLDGEDPGDSVGGGVFLTTDPERIIAQVIWLINTSDNRFC